MNPYSNRWTHPVFNSPSNQSINQQSALYSSQSALFHRHMLPVSNHRYNLWVRFNRFCRSYERASGWKFLHLDSSCSWSSESVGDLAVRMQSMVREDRMEAVLCFCHCICHRLRTRALTSARWSSSSFCSTPGSGTRSSCLLGSPVISSSAAGPTTPHLEPAAALSGGAAPPGSESGRRTSGGAPSSDPRRLSLVPDWFILCNTGGKQHRRQEDVVSLVTHHLLWSFPLDWWSLKSRCDTACIQDTADKHEEQVSLL